MVRNEIKSLMGKLFNTLSALNSIVVLIILFLVGLLFCLKEPFLWQSPFEAFSFWSEARLPQIGQIICSFLLSIFLLWVVPSVFVLNPTFQLVVEEGGRYFSVRIFERSRYFVKFAFMGKNAAQWLLNSIEQIVVGISIFIRLGKVM